ncbi:hypothetical protein DdX_12878 [Ditylenchus destructor]|uniref:F-box domain-containing protein n=1 Tax=Ditylenchus destructor TaxID=166010 RepID=A0AAD4MZV2_9BILA|nr:hypothetical protein DdX_12878 [Ditylenchus destructor]
MSSYKFRKRKEAPACVLSSSKITRKKASVTPKKTPVYLTDDILVDVFKHLNYSKVAECNLSCAWIAEVIRKYRSSLPRFRVSEISLDYIPPIRGDVLYNGQLMLRELGQPILHKGFNKWTDKYGYERKSPFHNQLISQYAWKNASVTMRVLQAQFSGKDYDKWYYFLQYNFFRRCYESRYANCPNSLLFCANIKSVAFNTMNWPLYLHFFNLLTQPGSYFEKISLVHVDFPTWQLLTQDMKPSQRIQCRSLHLFDIADPLQFSWIESHFHCDKLHFSLKMLDAGDADFPLDFIFNGTGCTKSLCVEYYRDISIVSKIVKTFQQLSYVSTKMPSMEFKLKEYSPVVDRDFETNFAQFLVKKQQECNIYQFPNSNNPEKKLRVSVKFNNKDDICHSPFATEVKLILC